MNKLNTSGEKVLNPYRLLGTYRALLALLVLLSHSNMWLPEWVRPLALGNVGVFLFFILSGFVIAEALDIFYPGKPQRFLLNRFLRIYPTYWSACVVAIVIYIWIPHPQFNGNIYSIFASLSIILEERLPSNEIRLISVVWAVGIELRFYVIAALIDYFDRLISRLSNLKLGQVSFAAGVIFLFLYYFVWATNFNKFGFSVMKFTPFFLVGFAYYKWLKNKSMCCFLFGIFALLATIHSYIEYSSAGPNTSILNSTMIFGIGLVIFSGLTLVTNAPRILEIIDKRLGDLTYSIYLVHWPIVYAVTETDLKGYKAFFTVLASSIFLSILIVLVIEKPLLQLRDSIRRSQLYH